MEKKITVFLDRDGVLNKKPLPHNYIKNFEEFFWNEGAQELVKEIKQRGLLAIVVSNQRGVARGMMTLEFLESLHKKMNTDLQKIGTSIDSFYTCPHEDGCECRKPKPGLFFSAVKDFNIDIWHSLMVGDSETDREAAEKAGCKDTILIESDSVDTKYIMSEIDRLLAL